MKMKNEDVQDTPCLKGNTPIRTRVIGGIPIHTYLCGTVPIRQTGVERGALAIFRNKESENNLD